MTLIQQFNRELASQKLLSPAKTIVVAVSTGVDSMVLLDLLLQVSVQQRPHLVVAHVNHHLRAQSAKEAKFLVRYCQEHAVTLKLADWLVTDHPQTGIEAAGRQFRYDFFAKVMATTDATAVLTAHHANDQAETYLMKLARGGDLAQLRGIQTSREFHNGRLVRPLLTFSKAQLRRYATERQLTFYEDVTNQDITLTRNRLRQRVVPELMQVNPEFLAHVTDYEQQLTTLLAAKAQMVASLLATVVVRQQLDQQQWVKLPSKWRLAVLQAWLQERTQLLMSATKLGPTSHWVGHSPATATHLQLNGTFELVKVAGMLDVVPVKKRVKKLRPSEKIMVDLNQWQKILPTQIVGIFNTAPTVENQPFSLLPSDQPLYWRRWQPGDQLQLKNGGHQTVRRILIDQKVPQAVRSDVQVLVNAHGTVLWLVGHKFSYRKPNTVGSQTVFLALKHTELKGVHLKR
ncbi:tRNA lysidine(34) synthetase TilS [Lactiplantibacillus sp. WILCCON 0030]|uniref:tRNA(Ile)-lysidine synthase n=1 Tax=Lactiplantibacillus brownii TaxID=3069269 RepID=A0ABU1A6D4_9LACO|nr:tRNA lysidine(34) synthetase TilS [Lactiplantibacillus brownii]MDQ7936448.1 tRNA lysidine(34) synthetase TilS [Lactiplantibacillus brownii]